MNARRLLGLLFLGASALAAACSSGGTSGGGAAAGNSAGGGAASCAVGLLQCATSCIDPKSDPQNCGRCGASCASGQVCLAGECSNAGCGSLTQCGQSCVDVSSSIPHCGECNQPCRAGATCSAGHCVGGAAGSDAGGASSAGASGAAASGAGASGSVSAGAAGMSGASGGAVGSGGAGTCDPGTTTTAWASTCPTAPPACTAGTWTAGGPDPDHQTFKLIKESDHFAIYSDETVSATTAQTALDTLENTVWKAYFGAPIYFKEPLCNVANKIKAAVHVHSDYGLTGGAWDSTHMGMWIGPGALADHWGLAHEFMHGVQSVSGGMSCNQSNTCGWIYESHANFMPHQLPEYRSNVHCSELSVNAPHLYLGSTRDRYCNWQFMEYLKDKYCYSAVNEIWTSAPSNDPFSQIMKTRGWNIGQMNDFLAEWATHNVTWDYQDPPPMAGGTQPAVFRQNYGSIMDKSKPDRRLRLTQLDPLDTSYATNRRFVVPSGWAPQRWGYNIVRLYPDAGATTVTVTFRGVTQSGADSDWRWALVATDSGITTPRYSAMQKGSDGSLTFCVNPGEALFLVVMGTPSVQKQIVWDQLYNTIYRYPWMVQLSGAWPDGFKGGMQDACAQGTRHANGGGCVVGTVPDSVYVGPYAAVTGGTVSGNARIDDHAVVTAGTVSGGTVAGLSVLMNGFSVSGTAKVATTFMPLGFFEGAQSASGTAQVIGDVEYRGQGFSETSGTYYGFVDSTIQAATSTTDVTIAAPYAWRP